MSAKGDLVLALLVEGLSVKEAAAQLGLTRHAVYRRLEFARRARGYATTRELVAAVREKADGQPRTRSIAEIQIEGLQKRERILLNRICALEEWAIQMGPPYPLPSKEAPTHTKEER